MKSVVKNLVLLGILGAIVWIGYRFYAQDDIDPLTGEFSSSEAALEGQLFLAQLNELRAIQFDTTLFADPRFRSLVDERPELVDEPAGRPNPFAPVQ